MVPQKRAVKACKTAAAAEHTTTSHQHHRSSRRGILGAKENLAKNRTANPGPLDENTGLQVTNFTETDKEEEGGVAEKGAREGPGLALEGVLPLHLATHPATQTNTSPGWLVMLPTFHTQSTHCLYTSHLA